MGKNTSPYFMSEVKDPREENRLVPNKEATALDLAKVNVEIHHIDMNDDWEKHLDKLANLYGMLYRDEIKISRMQMNNFDAKLKIFFEEHLHKDAEIRMIKSGTGYFDIRSSEDDWIRIPVSAGDFLYLPPGIYHRFTPDRAERVVAVRLFQSNPKWEAFPRSTTGDEQQERKQFLLVNGLQAPKKK